MDKPIASPFTRMLIAAYRPLLKAYPQRFRREYAPLMEQLVADLCQEADRGGRAGGVGKVWRVILSDLLFTIPTEHIRSILPTRNPRGPALMLGGLLFGAGFLLSNAGPAGGLLQAPGPLLLALSPLLLTAGLLGLRARYKHQLGFAGRAFLVFSALGSTVAMAGGLGLAVTGLDLLWGARLVGYVTLFLFMTLFGLVCLVRRPLPRFNGVPLLIGAWIPAGGLFAALYHAATGAWLGGGLGAAGILLTISLGFLLLGNMLRTDPIQPDFARPRQKMQRAFHPPS